MKSTDLISVFCRPVPFWSWNDKLEPDELRRQIGAMQDAGMGGFFMHARGYTAEAMNCCASAGKTPDGRSVICVTANAWTGEFCIEDHIALDSKYCGSAEAE